MFIQSGSPSPIGVSPLSRGSVASVDAAKPQEIASAHHVTKEQQTQIQSELLKIVQESYHSFTEMSDNVWGHLMNPPARRNKSNPTNLELFREGVAEAMKQQISQFKKENSEMFAYMQGKEWKKTIAELDKQKNFGMVDKLETYRKAQKDLQEKLAAMACEAIGIPPGTWQSFGTPGARSDIDNPLSNKGASERDQMFIKTLADTAWTHVFRGQSGTQADLEMYLTHPGRTRNLGAEKPVFNLFSELGKTQFNLLELKMAYLGERRNFGSNVAGWEAYKKEQLSIHKEIVPQLREIFKDIDAFEKETLNGIQRQYDKEKAALERDKQPLPPDLVKQAAMTYKTRRLMQISDKMDRLEAEGKKIFKDAYHAKGVDQQRLHEKWDANEVALATLAAIRNSLFDEAYLTQGAYIAICESNTGQLSERIKEAVVQKSEMTMRVSDPHLIVISNKQERRETFGREDPLPPSTLRQQLISCRENLNKAKAKLAVYRDKANKTENPAKKDEEFQHFAVSGAKYTERTANAAKETLLRALKDLKEGPEGPNRTLIEAELKEAVVLHEMTSDLEKCQRKFVLSGAVARANMEKMLKEARAGEHLSAEERQKIIEEVDKSFNVTEANRELSKIERYNMALVMLDRAKVVNAEVQDNAVVTETMKQVHANASPVVVKLFDKLTDGQKAALIQSAIQKRNQNPQLQKEKTVEAIVIDTLKENLAAAEGEVKLAEVRPNPLAQAKLVRSQSLEVAQNAIRQSREGLEKLQPGGKPVAKLITGNALETRKAAIMQDRLLRSSDPEKKDVGKLEGDLKELMAVNKAYRKLALAIDAQPKLTSGNAQIDTILLARAGFSRETDPNIEALHHQAEKETLDNWQLKTSAQVQQFMNRLEALADRVLTISVSCKNFTLPSNTDHLEHVSLSHHWADTK